MADSEPKSEGDKRTRIERRALTDTRSEEERQLTGERRSQSDRRTGAASEQPSKDQLSLFAKRIRRAIRDESSRHIFGICSGDDDFRGHPDVLRALGWIESLANS
jgi:hypothetical protein